MIQPLIVGWREWIGLPDLNIHWLKAKLDTGARTSCLHAFAIEPYQREGKEWIRFGLHPEQDNDQAEIWLDAPIKDKRIVRDSGGHEEERYVIETTIRFGESKWPAEITLTNRDNMKFRMLVGRTAMLHRLSVDPSQSFVLGRPGD